LETLLVAWSLVLIQRIGNGKVSFFIIESRMLSDANCKKRSAVLESGGLGCLIVFGIFNRITFPAFLVIPGLQLIPHFIRK
jgi:GPI mannosyltransferase 4